MDNRDENITGKWYENAPDCVLALMGEIVRNRIDVCIVSSWKEGADKLLYFIGAGIPYPEGDVNLHDFNKLLDSYSIVIFDFLYALFKLNGFNGVTWRELDELRNPTLTNIFVGFEIFKEIDKEAAKNNKKWYYYAPDEVRVVMEKFVEQDVDVFVFIDEVDKENIANGRICFVAHGHNPLGESFDLLLKREGSVVLDYISETYELNGFVHISQKELDMRWSKDEQAARIAVTLFKKNTKPKETKH